MEDRNLEFSLSHHRLLWQQSLAFPIAETDLITKLENRYLELEEDLTILSHIFHLNEKNKLEIIRTPQVVQATLACIEKVFREKRHRYFMAMWENVDPTTAPEQEKLYYANAMDEKMKIQELEKQRQFSIVELF